MVVMDIPKLQPDRTVRLVRVTIRAGVVVYKDDPIRMEVEKLKPIGGPSGADPEPMPWAPGMLLSNSGVLC